ncbi:uncharacterized protein LOC129965460 isoform X2 [Argiope bruennichi]|uniref:Uncharacterized protein n=1 Tax=Argiope bruennichi TaxID=94029 RepID=A0A8T0E7S7_ARGBR|nr:uncharacterized protein LOC129965460 isoform X2 [Argiope bruennichi]KAF8767356.1 hypothetical protein HNY73_020331 [Argiope bruennichi]
MSTKDIRKKGTKGYYVPSRYKQVAEGISKLSSHSKDSTRDGISSERTVLSSTAVRDRVALPPIDASAITYENNSCTTNSNEPSGSSTEFSKIAAPKKKEGSTKVSTTHAVKQQKTAKDTEKEVDLLYIEYLQAKLCESKAKKALEARSKNALEKIHELWSLMGALLGKNAAVKKDLDFVNYIINLNEHLNRQEKFLLPALEMISVLEKNYEEIASNVYSVRHQLGIKNIKLPDPGSEVEIIELLNKIKSLLDTVLGYIENCEEIISNSETADTLSKQGKFATEDLERGYQLVAEATDLLLTETSLKFAG